MDQEYIFGLRPAIEAIQAGKVIERVFLRKGMQGDLFQELFHLIRQENIPFQFVPVERLYRFTRKNHQGVVVLTAWVAYQPLHEVITRIFEEGRDPFVVVLDGVTDVRNLGAIARSAEAAGANLMLVPAHGSAQINADAVKTSAGALSSISVSRTPNLVSSLQFLKNAGIKLIGASEKAETTYFQRELKGPVALVMGAEDSGLSIEVRALLDEELKIPIYGRVVSLNVSVAAGILLFEISRQRNH